jgi:Concanavalin A-like lectin/glucanases superfamily
MPVLLSLLGSIASAAKLEGYAAIVEGLPGGPPLAHWRLDEAGGTEITDRKAARHGTYSGTIGYGASGLPQNSSNGAVNFPGTGSGSIPHDAGLELADFTLSFWFKVPEIPVEPDVVVLVSKDQSGRFEGDFVVRVEDAANLLVQFQSATADFKLTSADDAIVAGQTYHVCVRADNTGFDAYLNGQYLARISHSR